MARDWHEWHRVYDDSASPLAHRLAEVRRQVRQVLIGHCPSGRPVQVLSLCAGEGRDLLPELAVSSCSGSAVQVEIDPRIAERARQAAPPEDTGWVVDVRTADAGEVASWSDVVPVDLLLLCGFFGQLIDDDVTRIVAAVPALLRPGGTVIWTRVDSSGPYDPTEATGDPADWVRGLFHDAGLHEVAFVRPNDKKYRVGVHRRGAESDPHGHGELPTGRLFSFIDPTG